jgi:hypothetical protein
MEFKLEELRTPGPGKGSPSPPDTDVRAYLERIELRTPNRSQPASLP